MSKSYIDLLKDPRWQKRRLEIMNIDGFTCQMCYDTTKTLNVHHLIYLPGRMPWEAPDRHLITLCEDCHERQKHINLKAMLADLSINASSMIVLLCMLKSIIPELVNTPRATDQAIWSFCCDVLSDYNIDMDNFQRDLKEFKEKYGDV